MARPELSETLDLPAHGASVLPSVTVDSYNLEVEDEDGFIGDKASKGAFWDFVDKWRKPLRDLGQDPFGNKATDDLGKKQLAEALASGDPAAAGLVQSAIEEFAQQLTQVIRRFLRHKDWHDTECITIGGGFRGSRVGELTIARAALLLRSEGQDVDIEMIRNDPDEAGLLGAAHLLPGWMLKGHDGILAVDIGGTNIRAGVVELNIAKSKDLSKEKILTSEIWRHGDEETDREGAVEKLVERLAELTTWSRKNKIELAPVIGIGCPGIIEADRFIDRGGQNLPGNWESKRFNLPRVIRDELPMIGEAETMVVMHNDAVVQGLSEMPYMQEREHWGVLTIGTGLGNARYTNRESSKKAGKTKF